MSYDRFTDRARKVMTFANMEAQKFNHEYIGTEHILLGLLRVEGGKARNVLDAMCVSQPALSAAIARIVKPGPNMVTMGKLPQTPRAKKVVEHAIAEACRQGQSYVGTEHLLIGLAIEREGIAAGVLSGLGLTEDVLRPALFPPPTTATIEAKPTATTGFVVTYGSQSVMSVGDRVRVKWQARSPEMVIVDHCPEFGARAWVCQWFNNANGLEESSFRAEDLEHISQQIRQ